eukprot:TRINITY_DN8036_c0_g1_i1.p1 TRINITY_DN8036_c0_g1~~TRINITY_DN8036_c0_g1_i1.p1  ORF type:complete len:677 (-),score=194.06 TRINITY_DN8036_c0_g1_i1:304-2169(-)
MYEWSLMHRDRVTHVVCANKRGFLITASADGHVKFWKKKPEGIEFAKHFRAHLGAITGFSLSADETLLATCARDNSLKVFDVINFDMINIINLDYTASCCEWIFTPESAKQVVAIGSETDSRIRVYEGKGDGTALEEILEHNAPVMIMKYNSTYDTVVSVDCRGMMEYWTPPVLSASELLQSKLTEKHSHIKFRFKTDTHLYEFMKCKTLPLSLTFSPDGKYFSVIGKDRQVRVFNFLTGKIWRQYDESLSVYNTQQRDEGSQYHLDDIDFGRRLAVERELEKAWDKALVREMPASSTVSSTVSGDSAGDSETGPQPAAASSGPSPSKGSAKDAKDAVTFPSAVFDDSSNFLLFPCMLGIKVVNLYSNKLVKVLGLVENTERFCNLSLYQGKTTLNTATGEISLNAEEDPTLICTAYRKARFYLFTRRDPDDSANEITGTGRDIFNERPTQEDRGKYLQKKREMGSSAILRTTMGDIHLQLFPDKCPKTVENFVTHSKNNYYNGIIFHRVIKGFMIQTGDPLGDGTGGTSIWGNDFEDEFHHDLRHDRPGTLSMANAGPNTNGSQFFITTVPIDRLNNKHTVFGRVTKGMDVVHLIENARTDKFDKPFDDIKIVNVEVQKE